MHSPRGRGLGKPRYQQQLRLLSAPHLVSRGAVGGEEPVVDAGGGGLEVLVGLAQARQVGDKCVCWVQVCNAQQVSLVQAGRVSPQGQDTT